MCGRYSLAIRKKDLLRRWVADDATKGDLPPRYNIAPGQRVPVIRRTAPAPGRAELVLLRWGLVPAWGQESKDGAVPINARAESVATRPMFRELVDRRRCLVPADGFFEWAAGRGARGHGPTRFVRRDRRPFAMAGLWECRIEPRGGLLETFVILTTAANADVRPVHDRMPVILQPFDEELWLDPARPFPDGPAGLLRPCPDGELEGYPVSAAVNAPDVDDPVCVAHAPPSMTQGTLF